MATKKTRLYEMVQEKEYMEVKARGLERQALRSHLNGELEQTVLLLAQARTCRRDADELHSAMLKQLKPARG